MIERMLRGLARRAGLAGSAPPPALEPARAEIVALLRLRDDADYASGRMRERAETIERLSQCSPAHSSPEALSGYVAEAALRFSRTLEVIGVALREVALARPRMLEIGSNPFFQTLLIAERFPEIEHLGVNYF